MRQGEAASATPPAPVINILRREMCLLPGVFIFVSPLRPLRGSRRMCMNHGTDIRPMTMDPVEGDSLDLGPHHLR
jgi:hypothetical protein